MVADFREDMRSVSIPQPFATVALLAATLSCIPSTSGGILALLKGEQPDFQRVAFVGSAVVKEASGEAEQLAGINEWKPLANGTKLCPGDLVRTGQGSILLRMTESGSFVKVTPRTILRLAPLESGWDPGIVTGREEASGYVVRGCRGRAEFRLGEAEWQPVNVNRVIPVEATVRTEANAVVDLFRTTDQKLVRIQGAKQLTLESTAGPGGEAENRMVAVNR